ncbi:ABC transporter ATP-binding protein [Dactylosporangium cerinum]
MVDVTIEAAGLTKRFGPRTAVRELSITARRGDVVGLLGPNGSGKTTTIRVLTTVLPPTSGTFAVAGIPSDRPAEIRRRIGVLPESSGYPGQQTGQEYLQYHARLFGRSRTDAVRVARDLLAQVGLAERASSRISTYSRGMRQRLGIARALVNDPAVVFLDEPTLGLDPAGQRQVLDMVRDIAHGRHITVVLSTHMLPEVEDVCTEVIILNAGSVLVAGPMGEVMRGVTVQHSGQLRVPADQVGPARRALADVPGLTLDTVTGRPELIRITVDAGRDAGLNTALRAVLAADVPVLGFEVEGSRLSTAFLTMTAEATS